MTSINFFAISALVNGIVSITFGLLVISKNWRDRMNQVFFLMTLSLSIWAFAYWQWQIANNYDLALLWVRILSVGSLFIPIFFYHWVIRILNIVNLLNRIILRLSYFLSIVILFFVNSNLFIVNLEKKSIFQFWPNSGVIYDVYFSYIYIGLIIYSIYLLVSSYWSVKDKNVRGQILYIIFGCIIGFGGGLTNFPLWWGINILPFGNLLVGVFPFLLGYSILKYKLFNIRAIVSEMLTFCLLFFMLVTVLMAENWIIKLVYGFFFILTSIVGVILIKNSYILDDLNTQLSLTAHDLQKANERLLELNRQKSEFVSFATHQLRAPLTAIKGYASLILEGDTGVVGDEVKQAVTRIFDSSKTLANIVDDYLNLTRIELGTMKYVFDTIDLKMMIQDVVGELGPNLKKDGLSFSFKADENGDQWDWRITADRDKLKQVIANIIDNSIKYTPQGFVKVTLSSDKKKHKFIFKVEDNGIGIAPETLPLLFNKFSRAGNANKTNIKGTGLGLFVAKQIVESHHGTITASSPGEGKGSTFVVELEPFSKA